MSVSNWFSSGWQKRRSNGRTPATRRSKHSIALTLFVVIVVVMGGSSRADMSSLILLRPMAVLMLGYAMACLTAQDWKANKFIVAMAAAIVLLPMLQLVPLPPGLWGGFAGRDLIREIDGAAGLTDVWRPLSLSPAGTWNALFSLAVPAAVLFAGLSLNRQQRRALILLVLVLILISAVLGLLQILGPNGGPLYIHRITQPDSAVGLLANRNHHATFIAAAFPILAVLASDPEFSQRFYGRPLFAVLISAFLLPMILVIGSRAGMAVAGVAIAISLWLYFVGVKARNGTINRRSLIFMGLVGGLLVAMVVAALALGRAESVQRAIAWDAESDLRLRAWTEIADFACDYWPWGTGFGTFVDVYQVHELRELLIPAYFNQAHNDWLEILLTGGVAATIIATIAIIAWARRVWQLGGFSTAGPNEQLARLGLAIVFLFALASITDYPIRVPSMAAILMIAVLWTLPIPVRQKTETV
jgi:O-antigen ligase